MIVLIRGRRVGYLDLRRRKGELKEIASRIFIIGTFHQILLE